MAQIYADTLAIATRGRWTNRRVQILTELSVTVVDVTALIVVVETRAT